MPEQRAASPPSSRASTHDVARELAKWLRYFQSIGFSNVRRVASREMSGTGESSGVPTHPIEELSAAGREAEVQMPKPTTSTTTSHSSPTQPTAAPDVSESLADIQKDLGADCRRCKLAGGRKTIVFGSGNEHAEIVFVGEGPGADEDEQGLPFVGRAGQLLTDMIEKGLKIPRPEVYICNIVKCRPPQNRKPEPDEVASCRPFVERQIRAISPKVICALGATAAETLLGVKESMGRLRGKQYSFDGIPLIVTYHPAFLLRDPSRKADAWADLKMVLAVLRKARG